MAREENQHNWYITHIFHSAQGHRRQNTVQDARKFLDLEPFLESKYLQQSHLFSKIYENRKQPKLNAWVLLGVNPIKSTG